MSDTEIVNLIQRHRWSLASKDKGTTNVWVITSNTFVVFGGTVREAAHHALREQARHQAGT